MGDEEYYLLKFKEIFTTNRLQLIVDNFPELYLELGFVSDCTSCNIAKNGIHLKHIFNPKIMGIPASYFIYGNLDIGDCRYFQNQFSVTTIEYIVKIVNNYQPICNID